MSPPHNFGEYAERRSLFIQELIVRQVKGDALRVMLAVVEHSYGLRLDAAQFDSQQQFARMLGMREQHISRAVRELKGREMLRAYPFGGSWWYEARPLESWQADDDKLEVSPACVREARAEWRTAVQRSSRDPRQAELIPWTSTQQGDGGLTAAMQAKDEVSRVTGPVTPSAETPGRGVASYQTGNSEAENDPSRVTGKVTLGGRGEHAPTSVPQSMVHGHGHARGVAEEEAERDRMLNLLSVEDLYDRLDCNGRYVIDELLPELFGAKDAATYRRLWMLILCDRWANCGLRALGETKRRKIAGEGFKKGPGQYANWYFNDYKNKAKLAAAAKRAQPQVKA